MPLNLPVDEAIFHEVANRLLDVDRASVVLYRREPGNWTPIDRQIVVIKKSPERNAEMDYPGNPPAMAWRMPINIRLHIQQSEADVEKNTDLMAQLIADAHQALTSPNDWWSMGGLAENTEFGNVEIISPTGAFDCAVMSLVVSFRHSEGNPYEVR